MTDEIETKTADTFYVKETVIETVADANIEYNEDKGDSIEYGTEKHKRERLFGPFGKDDADAEVKRLKDRHKALNMDGTQKVEKISSDRVAQDAERGNNPEPAARKEFVTDVLDGKPEQEGNHPEPAAEKPVVTDVKKDDESK